MRRRNTIEARIHQLRSQQTLQCHTEHLLCRTDVQWSADIILNTVCRRAEQNDLTSKRLVGLFTVQQTSERKRFDTVGPTKLQQNLISSRINIGCVAAQRLF